MCEEMTVMNSEMSAANLSSALSCVSLFSGTGVQNWSQDWPMEPIFQPAEQS